MALSSEERMALHATLGAQIRHFIAGTILFHQQLADRVGLHMTDMQCINLLDLLGPVTPGKLAAWTGLTTGGVTVMLDRLEKAGFIRREPNPNDRRSILVQVDPKKLKKIKTLYAGIDRQFEGFLSATPEAELQSVVGSLRAWVRMRTWALVRRTNFSMGGGSHGSKQGLHLARQVRHHAQHALHHHQLAAVVHLVFLHAQNHLEARFDSRGHTWRHGHRFPQELVTQTFHPARKAVARFREQGDHLCLAAVGLLVGNPGTDETHEIETL